LKGGIIAFSGRHVTISCVVRDISDSGARLQVPNGAGVPDTFELIVELDGVEVHCVVVWRLPNEVGVEFVSAPSMVTPKRAQVVDASSSALARPSLRRNCSRPRDASQPTTEHHSSEATRRPRDEAASATAKLGTAAPESSIPILIADDDPDDRLLIEDAFRESKFSHPIASVENGEELLAYLRAEGKHAGRKLPGLILLDLNMPRMDGRTALMHIKSDRALRRIPVVVLTTSNAEGDIQRTYDLGVSAYISKPSSFSGLLDLVRSLNTYWINFVTFPIA
jgi:two-component system response regulator